MEIRMVGDSTTLPCYVFPMEQTNARGPIRIAFEERGIDFVVEGAFEDGAFELVARFAPGVSMTSVHDGMVGVAAALDAIVSTRPVDPSSFAGLEIDLVDAVGRLRSVSFPTLGSLMAAFDCGPIPDADRIAGFFAASGETVSAIRRFRAGDGRP